MLLDFPTGSQPSTTGADEVCGAIYFMGDLSWRFMLHDTAQPLVIEKITETVEFFAFTLEQAEFISEFLSHKKDIKNEDIKSWRLKNIKLVKNPKKPNKKD